LYGSLKCGYNERREFEEIFGETPSDHAQMDVWSKPGDASSKPKAVLLYPGHDYNGAFAINDHMCYRLLSLARIYPDTKLVHASTVDEAYGILKGIPDGTVEHLVVGGHGSPTSLGFGDCHSTICNLKIYTPSAKRFWELAGRKLSPGAGRIFLDACLNGREDADTEHNNAKYVASLIPGHRIYSSKISYTKYNLVVSDFEDYDLLIRADWDADDKPIGNDQNHVNVKNCEAIPEHWEDADGRDCEDYAKGGLCYLSGNTTGTAGTTAKEACCQCGGGQPSTQEKVCPPFSDTTPDGTCVCSSTDAQLYRHGQLSTEVSFSPEEASEVQCLKPQLGDTASNSASGIMIFVIVAVAALVLVAIILYGCHKKKNRKAHQHEGVEETSKCEEGNAGYNAKVEARTLRDTDLGRPASHLREPGPISLDIDDERYRRCEEGDGVQNARVEACTFRDTDLEPPASHLREPSTISLDIDDEGYRRTTIGGHSAKMEACAFRDTVLDRPASHWRDPGPISLNIDDEGYRRCEEGDGGQSARVEACTLRDTDLDQPASHLREPGPTSLDIDEEGYRRTVIGGRISKMEACAFRDTVLDRPASHWRDPGPISLDIDDEGYRRCEEGDGGQSVRVEACTLRDTDLDRPASHLLEPGPTSLDIDDEGYRRTTIGGRSAKMEACNLRDTDLNRPASHWRDPGPTSLEIDDEGYRRTII
jgi:hypothetical protein